MKCLTRSSARKLSTYKFLSLGKFLKTSKGMKDIGFPNKPLNCGKRKYSRV